MHADVTPTRMWPQQADDLMGPIEARMASLVGAGRRTRSDATQAGLHHLAAGGRRVRARLALHAALALRLDDDTAIALGSAAELLHNASLIHDDLQDRDDRRRDRPAVWRAFGDTAAVCAGDLMLSAAYAALAEIGDRGTLPALVALTHARVATAIEGQCADLAATATTPDDYERIARAKSGALLGLPLELALVCAGRADAGDAARAAAEHFAVGYQIADDLADLPDDEARGALNAVLVLRPSQGEAAERVARRLALRHLAAAMAGAMALPSGSGALLGTLAMRLSATL